MTLKNFTFTLLGLWLCLGLLPAKEETPPLSTVLEPQVLLKQETFRLPKQGAQSLLLAGLSDAQLHTALRKMVLAKTATLANLMLLRTRSGQRFKLEQIDELGYCTDFDDRNIPQTLTLINPRALGMKAEVLPIPLRGPIASPQMVPPSNAGFGNMTTITPTTFSVRNLGDTLEADVVVDAAEQRIRLTCALESVQYVGSVRMNCLEQPVFETQKLNTSVSLKPGAPCFLGTLSKSFQTGTVNANQDDALALCFVTATMDAPPVRNLAISSTDAVRYQWDLISLPKEAASSLLEEISDSALVYEKLRTMMKTNTAKLEGLQSVSAVSNTIPGVTAADEFPYPNDLDPPRLPDDLTIAEPRMMDIFHNEGGRDAPAPDQTLDPANGGFGLMTRAMPSRFETRNVGDYLEIWSTLHENGQSLHVVLAPERTRLLGLRKSEGIEQPIFETQRVNVHINLEFNRPLLLGTMNPPVNTGAEHGNMDDRIWLSFLTAKVPAPDPVLVEANEPHQVLLREEWFTLPKEDLRIMLVAGLSDAELRKDIQQRVAHQTATMDRFMMIRTKSGQRAKVEHINEFAYPTDFYNGQMHQSVTMVDTAAVAAGTKFPMEPGKSDAETMPPQQPGQPANGGLGLQSSASATTHTVRSLGDSWEVDPVISEDLQTIDLTYSSEQVRFIDDVEYGNMKQPQFQTRRLRASLQATSGQPILAGTCSRSNSTGLPSGNDDADVTVSFLTATITTVPRPLAVPEHMVAPRSGRFQFEMISLPSNLASSLTDERLDDPTMHQRLVAMIGEQKAHLEKLLNLRTSSGQRAKVEQIAETPYPTDFHIPYLGMTLAIADPKIAEIFRMGGRSSTQAGHRPLLAPPNAGFGMICGLLGSTWTVRNVGETIEIDPIIGEDGIFVDLTIAPESVRLVGQTQFTESLQPVFETQKLNTSITTGIGQPCLLGTMSKPTHTGAPGGNETDRVWLAFITPFLD